MSLQWDQPTETIHRHRWLAMCALCCGVFMTAIDVTVVNVALPVLGDVLHINDSAQVWVVNAYLCPFGGFLFLSGRLGDLFGRRRVFTLGIIVFTLASLGCGLSTTPILLLVSRSVQGLAAAAVSTASMALVVDLFPNTQARARALGVFCFVSAAGGSAGVLLGGVITGLFSWNWIFYINVPIGVAIFLLCSALIPHDTARQSQERLDVAGAFMITASLIFANFAVIDVDRSGWLAPIPLISGAVSIGLALLFAKIESHTRNPIFPRSLLQLRNFKFGSVAGAFFSMATLSWFCISALYFQHVLHLTPLAVGSIFLPATLLDAGVSVAIVPALIPRCGIKPLIVTGAASICAGLFWFARLRSGSTFWEIVPAMLFLGLGTGLAYNPLFLASLTGIAPNQAGIASGAVGGSWTLGGTLGLAVSMKIATERTQSLRLAGVSAPIALAEGYQLSLAVVAITVAFAALVSLLRLRVEPAAMSQETI